MKEILIFSVLILIFSCKTVENAAKAETQVVSEPVEQVKPQRPYEVKAKLGKMGESDPLTINSVSLDGNFLTLEVSYTGGCGMHEFEFIGSEVVMKSLPPKRTVKLIHHNGDDTCESVVHQSIRVDISDLAYKTVAGEEIILLLAGTKEEIKFIYQ